MPTSAPGNANPCHALHRLLPQGESLVAMLGTGTLVIVLATLCSAAWLSVREQRELFANARWEQVRAVADLLGKSAETMLASGELSALRRLVVDAKRDHRLSSCQIVLPDGRALADSQPSKAHMVTIPASWPQGPLDSRVAASPESEIAMTRTVLVPGRGPAILVIRADVGTQATGALTLIAGLGKVSIAGLLALMLLHRRLRKRVRGLAVVREALLSFGQGERSPQALAVAENLGPEAVAWNGVWQEIDRARQDELARAVSDKTDRRREMRSEMELACDSLYMGLAILDAAGVVRHANLAAASLLRIKREELVGHGFAGLLKDASARSAVEAVVDSAPPQRRSVTFTRQEQDVTSVLRLSVRPLRKEDNGSALVMIEDITQQRVAEASRNSFVTQATHELRTPLTNMRLCLETAMGDGASDTATQAQCFNVLNQETRRLERVVTEMLSVAEIEAGSMKLQADDVRLDSLFDELRADFGPLAKEKRLELRFDLPPKFPVLRGDRDKLVLAAHNLLGNAIKYTPSGGTVTVMLRAENDRVAIDFVDTGIGIKEEECERVFEKFYRAKDLRVAKIPGSGLGLALSREVARLHGGDVTLHSELNHGSTFTLTVPIARKAA